MTEMELMEELLAHRRVFNAGHGPIGDRAVPSRMLPEGHPRIPRIAAPPTYTSPRAWPPVANYPQQASMMDVAGVPTAPRTLTFRSMYERAFGMPPAGTTLVEPEPERAPTWVALARLALYERRVGDGKLWRDLYDFAGYGFRYTLGTATSQSFLERGDDEHEVLEAMMVACAERAAEVARQPTDAPTPAALGHECWCGAKVGVWCVPTHAGERDPGGWCHPARHHVVKERPEDATPDPDHERWRARQDGTERRHDENRAALRQAAKAANFGTPPGGYMFPVFATAAPPPEPQEQLDRWFEARRAWGAEISQAAALGTMVHDEIERVHWVTRGVFRVGVEASNLAPGEAVYTDDTGHLFQRDRSVNGIGERRIGTVVSSDVEDGLALVDIDVGSGAPLRLPGPSYPPLNLAPIVTPEDIADALALMRAGSLSPEDVLGMRRSDDDNATEEP